MKMKVFAERNLKELVRDPLNIGFGIGFPLVLLFLLSAMQANIPVSLFEVDKLTPGLADFGLSFISLFSGLLIAKDRTSSFLLRLFTSPLTATNFIAGYTLPLLPIALAQGLVCFIAAAFLGLKLNFNVIVALLTLIPPAMFFIGIGLLTGALLNDKQVGGICGPILTNVSAWLSGTWFELDLVGGTFKKISYSLPFAHAVDATRAAIAGNYGDIFPHLWWVIGYGAAALIIAILVFKRRMTSENI